MRALIKKLYFIFLKIVAPVVFETAGTSAPVTFRGLFVQKVLRINGSAYWPVHYTSKINGVSRIKIGVGTAPGLSPGCYIQGIGHILIGDYTLVGPNVGIISANHDPMDPSKHIKSQVKIGSYCWLGMGSIVLPGVELGNHTVVAAGSVVTKSFDHGYCVIGGNPAFVIKYLVKEDCVRYENKYKYYGFVPAKKFESYCKKKLMVEL
ncbi:DapH/DapD/GlmU-related protein [Marinobacterium sp. xm-a-152]|uniref:acyltransferase n=1 Tax=Marinobacterium sp. xm-a-152 TaxID=2497733 RepID=UPI0019E0628F|nr:acyltransferase [Marinobacterium sp. xm-a-152]NRP15027.1 Maltose O-acetyltransferase [Marinobacterium sp. xm-a-152]